MKVIDLLNKIANEEDIPSPIYHNNLYYDFEDGDYFNQKTRNWLFNDNDIDTILNDEVEIIEEDKKIPEKIDQNDLDWNYLHNTKKTTEEVADNLEHLRQKVNQIIDYLEDKQC